MNNIKKVLSVLLSAIIVCSAFTCGFAYDTDYNSSIDNLQNVTATVQNQGSDESCLAYALAATAESYCIKNRILADNDFTFSGEKLKKNVGDSTNFGTVLYSAVNFNLGENCYITGIENLTGRGERYLQRKIKENGAVFVAIPLPEGGMKNTDFYNDRTYSFNCKDASGMVADFSGGIYHAVSIVGWDDNFSCENFNGGRARNGAWICKNSYGKDWGKNGYFYLSNDYTDHFLYSAAIEVTRYPEIISVKAADKLHLSFHKVGAVGFRYGADIENAGVTVTAKGADDQTVKAHVSNGYTFVPLSSPVYNSDIRVKVDGNELAQSAISIYYIKSGNDLAAPSKPRAEENWDVAVDNLNIELKKELKKVKFTAVSTANNKTVYHRIKLNSVDNRFTIVPDDGYYFTDDTDVTIEKAVEGHVDPKIISGKISELSDELIFDNGKLIIKSENIGDAYVKGLRIDLDESSRIKTVYLIEDNGSEKALKSGEYSIETSPETIPDKGFYYARVKIDGYYAAYDFRVILTRNGKKLEIPPADVSAEGDYITADVIINIPDITDTIFEMLVVFINLFTGLANAFRGNR